MSKPATRLLPRHVDALPWEPVDGAPDGVELKRLAVDPATGARTLFVRGSAAVAWRWPGLRVQTELYVLRGRLHVDGAAAGTGGYVCRGPGSSAMELRSEGAFLLWLVEGTDHGAKPDVLIDGAAIERLPWRLREGQVGRDRVLACDERSETLLIHIRAGAAQLEPLSYASLTEETLFLEGACLEGDVFNDAGTYTCFPPGASLGPFYFPHDILLLSVKISAGGPEAEPRGRREIRARLPVG